MLLDTLACPFANLSLTREDAGILPKRNSRAQQKQAEMVREFHGLLRLRNRKVLASSLE
jgi:hypothetical protein